MIKKEIIEKAGFLMYDDYWDKYFLKMSGDQVKEVMQIIFHFNKTFEVMETKDLAVEMVINTILDNLKRDAEKRLKQSEANRENGKKGGRPPKDDKPKKTPDTKNNINIPEWIDAENWNEWIRLRPKKKYSNSPRALNRILNAINQFVEDGYTYAQINKSLESSMIAIYPEVYEPKGKKQATISGTDDVLVEKNKAWNDFINEK